VYATVDVTAASSVDTSSTSTSTNLNVSDGSLGSIPIQNSVISGSGPRFEKIENRKSASNAKKIPRTPVEKRSDAREAKLHHWLYSVVERLGKGETTPAPNESLFVHDGKADIKIELSSRSPELLEKLKAAGFEITADKGKTTLIGKIPLDKLAALTDIDEVRLILPKT